VLSALPLMLLPLMLLPLMLLPLMLLPLMLLPLLSPSLYKYLKLLVICVLCLYSFQLKYSWVII
jgi:hypothetical protein